MMGKFIRSDRSGSEFIPSDFIELLSVQILAKVGYHK